MRFNVFRGTFEADEKPFNQLLGYVWVDHQPTPEETAAAALAKAKKDFGDVCKCPAVSPSNDTTH